MTTQTDELRIGDEVRAEGDPRDERRVGSCSCVDSPSPLHDMSQLSEIKSRRFRPIPISRCF